MIVGAPHAILPGNSGRANRSGRGATAPAGQADLATQHAGTEVWIGRADVRPPPPAPIDPCHRLIGHRGQALLAMAALAAA
jgi:hypothetical protein